MSRSNAMIKSLLATFASLLMVAAADTVVAQPFAYVTSTNTVTVINTATNTVVDTIMVAGSNLGVKFRPAGDRAYVVNNSFSTVSVIDTAISTVVATVPVGGSPQSIAVKPDGSRVYVSNSADNTVSVIDTSTNTVIGIPIVVGSQPVGLAVSPDGSRLYVGNASGSSVTVIDTSTNLPVVGSPVTVGPRPNDIVFKPDGTRAYVTNNSGSSMSVIDTSSLTATTVPLGVAPCDIAIDPSGSRLYITTCNNANTVLVLDTVMYLPVSGSPVTGGSYPKGVAVNAAGTFAYAANLLSNTVSVINTSTNMAVFVPAGNSPTQIAINPTSNATVPGAPTIGTVTAGVGSATVNYAAPAFNGGSVITSYTAKSNPGNITGSATSGPITVTGLTNGTAYTFTVTATNAVGTSPPSAASNSVTPSAPSATYAPPAGLDFGMRTVGGISPSMQGTFTNTSAVSLVVSSVSFSGGGAGFNVLGSSQCLTPTLILTPGGSCTFDITSQPNAVGILTDSVSVLTSPANAAVPPALPLTVTGVAPPPILATVINTADSGPGSLRQAITDANAGGSCGPTATINFNIPGGGLKVITPFLPLPTLLCPNTTIDGYTQPGASANTLGSGNNAVILVALDGASMMPPGPGLALNGNNILVRGINIRKFIGQPGIRIQGGAGVKIEG